MTGATLLRFNGCYRRFSLGIENFLRFGIDGPTKYGDMGEKYIKLYGALNATYLQQQAAISLFKNLKY
jgi:hypothetical protein